MSIIGTIPNTFVNDTGDETEIMESTEMIANFNFCKDEVNANAVAKDDPTIVGALPYSNLLPDELADANKVMANFQFIRQQVNANAESILQPVIREFPHILQNELTNDATQVNENFQHIVDEVNARAVPIPSGWVVFGTVDPGNVETQFTSDDGETWLEQSILPDANMINPRFANDIWVSPSFGKIYYSTELTSWSVANIPSLGGSFFNTATNNGTYWLAAAGADIFDGEVIRSTDGINWTQIADLPATAKFTQMIAVGANFYIATESGDFYESDDNGDTWTLKGSMSPTGASKAKHIVWNGSMFLVSGWDSSPQNWYATSPDGVTWTDRTFPVSQDVVHVAYGNGAWVTVPGGNTLRNISLRSTNGVTWTQNAIPDGNESWQDISHNGQDFVAVANAGIGFPLYIRAIISEDGISWTSIINENSQYTYRNVANESSTDLQRG